MSTKKRDSTQTSFATSSKAPPSPRKIKRTRTSDRRDAEDIDKEGLSELKRQRPSSPSPSSSAAESPKERKVTEQLEGTTRKKRKRRSERTVQTKRVKRRATSDDANSSPAESSLVTDQPRYNLRRGSARLSKSYSVVKPVDKLISQQQDDKPSISIDSLSPPTQVAETPSNPLLNPVPSTSSTKSLLTKQSGSVKETEKASEPVGSAGPSSLRLGYSYIDHSVASDSTKTGHSQDSPRRLSRKKKQGQTRLKQRRALTVDNILKELKGVSWKTLGGTYTSIADGVLELYPSQKTKIEREYTTEDDRKKAGITYWTWNHPYSSWRLLITRLYLNGEHAVADKLRQYAEKLTDPTLTHENVSKVTATLGEDKLADVLEVPVRKREEFQQQSSTTVEYRNKVIDYFLKYSYIASWSDVSSHLYFEEQDEALAFAREFIKGTSEPTLTLHNLTTLLENVEHDWYWIGIYLNIPRSKLDDIRRHHSDNHQRSSASWKVYLTEHPQPSWKEVSYALYQEGHFNELEVLQKKYLKGTAENRRQFEEAMKYGRIRAWLCKLLSYGSAGAGKTSVKEMLVGNEPPEQRNSTPLAMRPATVCRVNLDEKEWAKLTTLNDRKMFLARALAINDPDLVTHLLAHRSEEADASVDEATSTHTDEPKVKSKLSTETSTPSASAQPHISGSSESISSDESIESDADDILQSISTDQELIRPMDNVSTKVHPRLAFKILQIIDSGGQSQFHEILPIFLRRLHFYMFVFRLCDELGSRPEIEYYVDNKPVGPSFKSTQTIEQLLQHCARTMHSHKSSSGNKGESPQIFVIGTHLDQEEKSKETRKQKNEKILKLLLPTLGEQIVYHDVHTKEVIIPVNAKNPGHEEEDIIEQIRERLMDESSIPAADIPSRWFALEILSQEMAQLLKRGVLSREECFDAAIDKLHFEEDAAQFDAAIQYLDDLSVLFHYPHTLPGVIFADPQVLLDKVTELVLAAFQTNNVKFKRDEWRKFYEFALVTAEFLSQPEFSKHYVPGLFEVKDLILLFIKLLIFAHFGDARLFVPALLRDLGKQDVDKCRISSSCVPSLAVQFPDGGPRKGVFCSLLCSLVSPENQPQWSISTNEIGTPICLHRNCVQLRITDSPGSVTLIDTYTHFELHVNISDEDADDLCPEIFPTIRESIFRGLRKATLNLGYYDSSPRPALVCPCGNGDSHIATAKPEIRYWTCSLKESKYGKLSPHQLLWIAAPSETAMSGQITNPDRLFLALSKVVYSKYFEIGIELGLKSERLSDELETGEFRMLQGSKKALKMFELWKQSVTEDNFTYSVLAAALEKHGFRSAAHEYCYAH